MKSRCFSCPIAAGCARLARVDRIAYIDRLALCRQRGAPVAEPTAPRVGR